MAGASRAILTPLRSLRGLRRAGGAVRAAGFSFEVKALVGASTRVDTL